LGNSSLVHGITPSDIEGAPSFDQVAAELASLLDGRVIAGHNLYFFDLRFLRAEFRRAGGYWPFAAAADTMRIGTAPFTTLEHTCETWGVDLGDAHCALADARATAELFSLWIPLAREQGLTNWGELRVNGELFAAVDTRLTLGGGQVDLRPRRMTAEPPRDSFRPERKLPPLRVPVTA
jgi:DNA polymerase III epsilon subunit-like protein